MTLHQGSFEVEVVRLGEHLAVVAGQAADTMTKAVAAAVVFGGERARFEASARELSAAVLAWEQLHRPSAAVAHDTYRTEDNRAAMDVAADAAALGLPPLVDDPF